MSSETRNPLLGIMHLIQRDACGIFETAERAGLTMNAYLPPAERFA